MDDYSLKIVLTFKLNTFIRFLQFAFINFRANSFKNRLVCDEFSLRSFPIYPL